MRFLIAGETDEPPVKLWLLEDDDGDVQLAAGTAPTLTTILWVKRDGTIRFSTAFPSALQDLGFQIENNRVLVR